ncbi:ARHG5 factor, partial [Semnornis frantzii]|nr:ARHG5 factor [Semnornis frantzii]
NGNAGFQQVLERLESDPVCQRLSLKSFLILPFQRITRLKLLLQVTPDSLPCCSSSPADPPAGAPGGSTDPTSLIRSLPLQLIKDCNENVQRMKSTEELIYLSQKIEFECKV